MLKYYILLFLAAGIALYYVFLQDPCNRLLRTDFSDKHPDYEIVDSGSREGSTDSVHCHIYYKKPGSEQIYEDVWLYESSASGWNFSRIIETREMRQTP